VVQRFAREQSFMETVPVAELDEGVGKAQFELVAKFNLLAHLISKLITLESEE
jgi:hypothetical protein